MTQSVGIIGYTQRPSYRPGETVAAGFSLEDGSARYSAELIRLTGGDDGSAGPGFSWAPVAGVPTLERTGARQAIHAGSYVLVERCPELDFVPALGISVLVRPSLPNKRHRQAILARMERGSAGLGLGLSLDPSGAPEIWLRMNGKEFRAVGKALLPERWHLVVGVVDGASGRLTIRQCPVGGRYRSEVEWLASVDVPDLPARIPGGELLFAAARDDETGDSEATRWQFDGRIEAPTLYSCDIGHAPLTALVQHQRPATGSRDLPVVCRWDFSQAMDTPKVLAIGHAGAEGQCINLPTRAVTGAAWNGQTTDWRHRPDLYGAIHFHIDDLEDCLWPMDAQFALPGSLPSGVYAIRALSERGATDVVPFFALPARERPRSRLAFLASTFTYLAYANSHHGYEDPLSEPAYGAALVLSQHDLFLNERRDLGVSLYDRHLDGAGACLSSWRRPILNMRPDGKLWNFAADLHLIGWLEASGIPYDVISDDALHHEGASLLEEYACLVTGTHPEYHSRAMIDAIGSWIARGGRLFYAGGNGFYWRVATSPHHPHSIEVRRGEAGTRCHESNAGERHHQFDGEFGGLWRANGVAPQSLVGVGFVAEGFDSCSYYVRTEAGLDQRAAFIFEGVDPGERIGDFGRLGGAAGLELDATDQALGTPAHALVLARSVNHSNVYVVTPEVMISSHPYIDAISNPLVRAEMTFFETPAGGAVFSTGSIAWAASLCHDGFRNNVARISGNVIRRFLDPEPFAMPASAPT